MHNQIHEVRTLPEGLIFLTIKGYQADNGSQFDELGISYQVFGCPLNTAPVILVNHALTGNSDVAGEEQGWWKAIIGSGKVLDTDRYTILAFNIPGNGYDGQLIDDYQALTSRDIAQLFIRALALLNVSELYAAIGGSLGGGIAWEMAVLSPQLIKYLIPVAADWKSSDWIIGHNHIQESILSHSSTPLQDARMMAMLFYRTPGSLTAKFNRTKVEGENRFNVSSWLQHHGEKLDQRFELQAYRLMNHLLTTIDITGGEKTFEESVNNISSTIIQVAVDSDLFFTPDHNQNTKKRLDALGIPNHYFEIKSIHGHDAFLIENEQLTRFLAPFF